MKPKLTSDGRCNILPNLPFCCYCHFAILPFCHVVVVAAAADVVVIGGGGGGGGGGVIVALIFF